ncbi:haloacid dehalogenase-like hydrolase [Methylocystis sp. WRRC1]|uniref:HAD family hydrolase n=1 Tax=Methylocystis sp. WRRC1 TaxID=1732014 RepID=UPI001D1400EC|nr:HAD family hydrolase [Methylocystis sp. WRRC1]MCC3244712.1 haloacid dehalogenase-like hydrolase [Methylocystis sp. WRRC1]
MKRPFALVLLFFILFTRSALAQDNLPSWNDGPVKRSIIAFVDKVTNPGGPDFVKSEDRVAVFDSDGTLWTEWPLYSPVLFAVDRARALAPKHPEWRRSRLFDAALKRDLPALAKGGEPGMLTLVGESYSGDTPEAFKALAGEWVAHAQHPYFKQTYDRLVYQPMLELLNYLRANGFRTYIVSGVETEFMRAFSERVYGIPPEQVIGSHIRTSFLMSNGKPILLRRAKLDYHDVKSKKPETISQFIGRRPILAFGNSDGDVEMLQWTTAGEGPRLGLLVHHDDAEREASYDRKSLIGKLDRGLDEAPKQGWSILSMKNDWRRIFKTDKSQSATTDMQGAGNR